GLQLGYCLIIIMRVLLLALMATMVIWSMVGTAPIQFSLSWWLVPVIGLILANYIYRFRFTKGRDLPQWVMVICLVPIEIYITYDQLLTLLAYTKNLLIPSKSW